MVISILQDVNEVLTVWVLGFGDGATKLVRPLYEKVLTFAYLARNQAEIQDFIDYSSVHWHKMLQEGAVASDEGTEWVSEEERNKIKAAYERVRDRFRMTDCKKCGTTRPTSSWTKKGTPELPPSPSSTPCLPVRVRQRPEC